MKSYNHLYEQYISDENIKLAIKNVCKHKLKRRRFRELHDNPDKYIEWIRSEAIDFRNDPHIPVEIYDGIQRKKRTIIVPTFREQIIHHMVVNVLKPVIMRPMYEHSYGSIPKRGGTMGMKRIKRWLAHDTKNTKYCLKMDIRKLSGREIINDHCSFFVDSNGIQVIVDYETIGAGVDIDELSELLKRNTALIYQRVAEQLQKEKNNASTT